MKMATLLVNRGRTVLEYLLQVAVPDVTNMFNHCSRIPWPVQRYVSSEI